MIVPSASAQPSAWPAGRRDNSGTGELRGLRCTTRVAWSREPSQRNSLSSEDQASAPSAPSTSNERRFLRPALTCETVNEPRAPLWKRSRTEAKSSVAMATGGADASSTTGRDRKSVVEGKSGDLGGRRII